MEEVEDYDKEDVYRTMLEVETANSGDNQGPMAVWSTKQDWKGVLFGIHKSSKIFFLHHTLLKCT